MKHRRDFISPSEIFNVSRVASVVRVARGDPDFPVSVSVSFNSFNQSTTRSIKPSKISCWVRCSYRLSLHIVECWVCFALSAPPRFCFPFFFWLLHGSCLLGDSTCSKKAFIGEKNTRNRKITQLRNLACSYYIIEFSFLTCVFPLLPYLPSSLGDYPTMPVARLPSCICSSTRRRT